MCIGPPCARGRYSISDAPSWSAPNGCPNQRTRLSSACSSQGSSSAKFSRRMTIVSPSSDWVSWRDDARRSTVGRRSDRGRLVDGLDGRAHHAVVLALGPVVAEPGLLVQAASDVVEELG